MYSPSAAAPSGYTPCVLGPAGSAVAWAAGEARVKGAERISAVDLSDDRLELARDHGASDTWTGGADVVERVLEETGGYGADFTFEATGNVQVMRQAVEAARMGWGTACMIGVAGKGETLDLGPRFLIARRTMVGASLGGV